MQILKVMVELYRNFDIELARPEEDWHVSGAWLTRQTHMDMKLSKARALCEQDRSLTKSNMYGGKA